MYFLIVCLFDCLFLMFVPLLLVITVSWLVGFNYQKTIIIDFTCTPYVCYNAACDDMNVIYFRLHCILNLVNQL